MTATFQREPRVKVGMTVRRDQAQALRELAMQEKHGNVSYIVQRAIDRELERAERERIEKEQVA